MLSQMEKHQLKHYCETDPELSLLIRHMEETHRMELSRISHEIRNPVTLINSFCQLTQTRYPEVTGYSTWDPIMENLEYLKLLLNELSDYNNSGNLKKEEFSLTDFLRTLTEECRLILNPIQIEFQKKTAIPPACFDKTKLRAAVLNLIRNAAEALAGDENGQITLTLSFDGEQFHICVANNGPQIPPEHLPKLTEPFVTYKKKGTGLGLAIVHNIVQAHEGSITISSDLRETCFTIHLPLCFVPNQTGKAKV